jgi:hypothetical protein
VDDQAFGHSTKLEKEKITLSHKNLTPELIER